VAVALGAVLVTASTCEPPPPPPILPGAAVDAAAGSVQTCIETAAGAVKCWGFNAYGQLGNGTLADSALPVTVSGLTSPTDLAVGQLHACAVVGGGSVRCWGYNGSGELGDGTTTDRSTPVDVAGVTGITEVAAGAGFTCGLSGDRTVSCWGGMTITTGTSGATDATQIAAGAFHACALHTTGSVSCWGSGQFGQLGNGVPGSSYSLEPVPVVGITNAVQIASGLFNTCAILATGTVSCWGNGPLLGTAYYGQSSTPAEVLDVAGATQLALGNEQICALLTGGVVKCWGANDNGQLGLGVGVGVATVATVVPAFAGAVQLVAGDNHTCARFSDGTMTCSGANAFGQLGDGTQEKRFEPVSVVGVG